MPQHTPAELEAMDPDTRKAVLAAMPVPDLLATLEALLSWADYMGGFESDVWRKAETAARQARGEPEPDEDEGDLPNGWGPGDREDAAKAADES